MLTRIEAQLPHLSQAEQRVGQWILGHSRAAIEQDTRSMAAQIGVSQPTLVRFARSLGCTGFHDFRMKLAQALGPSGRAQPSTLESVAASTDLETLARRLYDFTAHAVVQARDALEPQALAKVIRLLRGASRVLLFGFGNGVGVVQAAVLRFMCLPLQATALTDPHAQQRAAEHLGRGDVLIIVSHDGHEPLVAQAVAAAAQAGAHTVAVTTSGSPLQRQADLAFCIDIPDTGDALTPATAQLAQLALLDLMVIGTAARRNTSAAQAKPTRSRQARAAAAAPAAPERRRRR